DVEELRELVDRRLPQYRADPRHASVAAGSWRERVDAVCGRHRAEFVDRKDASEATHAALAKENRAAVFETDRDRGGDEDRQRHQERAYRDDDVERAFAPAVRKVLPIGDDRGSRHYTW